MYAGERIGVTRNGKLAAVVSGTDTSSYGGIDVIWVFSNSL